MQRRLAAGLLVVLLAAGCGGSSDGGNQPPPGAPSVALVGQWPDSRIGRALRQRVFTERLDSEAPVLINPHALATLDEQEREVLRERYAAGYPVGVLDATQAEVDVLASLLGRAHGVVTASARTPLVMLGSRAGHSRADFVLFTASEGADLEREVQAVLDFFPDHGSAAQVATQGASSACPNANNLACLLDEPYQVSTWSDCVATWNATATQFAFYNCAEDQYYVGLNFLWNGTVPSGYSWSEVVVPATGFNPQPSGLTLYNSTPESSQSTTTVTTGTEFMIGGGASFGVSSSDGGSVAGGVSFAASQTFVNETTTEVLSTDVQNLSSTETGEGNVLYQYQNFSNQCPGPYCYWAGNAPTCDKKNAECDSGFTAAINIQCDGNYPYECDYGDSPSDNTGGCGDECDIVGSGKDLCCPAKSSVQNCFTSQTAAYIWTFEPSAALSCPTTMTVTADFRDDWPPVCSPSSPTTTDQGQCGPTFTNQYLSRSISYTIDLPAQCCSSECAAPPPTPDAPTPTPVPNPPPGGSWTASCTQTFWDGTTLCATCQNTSSTCQPATCISNCTGSASNVAGVLTCGS